MKESLLNPESYHALIADDDDLISVLANTAAYINQLLPDLNWVGFYLKKNHALVLGPFQGKPACTRIALNQGVCGAAFTSQSTLVVPDVHQFAGHIACDAASRSEIVVPLREVGVLDLDSPILNRFTDHDRAELELLTQHLMEHLKEKRLIL